MTILNKGILLVLFIFVMYSCNTRQENETFDQANSRESLAPCEVTVIADLPDSLQPKAISFDEIPAPKVILAVSGETRMVPVLQNESGEPIVDYQGQPFVMGDGGKSNFTNFSTDNGLALDGVRCLAMDNTGILWFGTDGGGVSRYDGKSFTTFTTSQGLANNRISSILVGRSGTLWIGTYGGGVSRYDGKSFTRFTTTQGLANNNVLSIGEDNEGHIWFGTDGGGVSLYDGKSFTRFTAAQGLASNVVYSITGDKTGNLWFGTNGGVSRYDGQSFTNYTTAQGLARNDVRSIAEDKNGNLWFGTYGGGVSRYDGKTFARYTTAQGLANNTVLCMVRDRNENLWFGTDGGGVSLFNGDSFSSFTTDQGLANNTVLCMTEDLSGNLWMGTYGGGVSRYDGKAFTIFTAAHGLANNSVFSILEDRTGDLWFGTRGGVSRYDGRSFTSFTTAQGLTHTNVTSILEDRTGALWFGTVGGGVSRYNRNGAALSNTDNKVKQRVPESFTNFTTDQGIPAKTVYSIVEDRKGNIWFGTFGGGLCRYDVNQQALQRDSGGLPMTSFTRFTTDQGLAHNSVLCMMEDRAGILWIGTYGGGVSRYDGKTFISVTAAQGLANNNVFSIFEDKEGNLWFGTEEGLSVLSEQGKREIQAYAERVNEKGNVSDGLIHSFKITDGLPDNFVTQVLQLHDGKMAIGTNQGIAVFSISEGLSSLTDIEIYNSTTGFPVKDVNVGQKGMYLDSKGVVWAATGSEKTALVRFDYTALHKSAEPPHLVIQSIKVKDENICWYNLQNGGVRTNLEDSTTAVLQEFSAYGRTLTTAERDSGLKRFGNIEFDSISKFYPLPHHLVLPYEHNHIAFEFAAIETGRPVLVKYQHMLEGYDTDWSPVTSKSNANFGNIDEGTYTFKLKAQGANGAWTAPITYSFTVLPPWYRTWWAYVIYASLSLISLRVFVKWRERNLRMEKEKLEHIVDIRTAEVVSEKMEVERQKKRSDDLLLNILPEEVAEELKAKGSSNAKQFDRVTVMFTDFKGFTQISEKLTPAELVAEIDTCFKAFDTIITKHNIEKIKTIGDAYMCAGGLPVANSTHATDVVLAAMEIRQFMDAHNQKRRRENKESFEIRIGIHTGPVVAGIVGVKKFAYDIWGDTVNIASRMESSGESGKVNISAATYEMVKDKFTCTHRGRISAKNKGEIDMYFVETISQQE